MIDFNKISKIKTKKDIKKYKIDEPLFLSNYLFHYFIMTDNLKGVELVKHPIYKENNEGLQGFHLAAKVYSETKSLKMLKLLFKKYSDYASNINYFNETFLNYFGVSDDLITLIKENKDVHWDILLTHEIETDNNSKKSFLLDIFYEGSYKLITFILDKFIIDWKELRMIPFFQLPHNNNLKTKEIINILEKIKKKGDLGILNHNGSSIVFSVIKSQNLDLLKYLIKNDLEIDKYIPIYTLHPFIFAYEHDILHNKGKDQYKISEYIWSQIKKTHNFESTNKFGENLAYSVIKIRSMNASGSDKLEKDILKRNTVWNKPNVDRKTILHLLIILPFKKYSKLIKHCKVDIKQKDSNDKTILDYAGKDWKEFLEKQPKIESKNDVVFKEYKFADTNSFSSTIIDSGLLFIHLDKKYKNLYIPKYLSKIENNLEWDGGMILPHPLVEDYNNFAWVIYWEDKNNYMIHPQLNLLINAKKNDDKYDCATVLLSVRLPHGGLHAELIYYDFRNNFIERFDPYGNSFDIDPDLDDILEEELTWNTGFYYQNVKKYLPVSGFQSLSDELNELNEKPGDFGGYCLAWCLWYLEHRILNNRFTAKKLIPKLLDKILKSKNSLIEYIRNYANDINKHRLKLLKKIGIKKNRLTNTTFTYQEEAKMFQFMIKETTID